MFYHSNKCQMKIYFNFHAIQLQFQQFRKFNQNRFILIEI